MNGQEREQTIIANLPLVWHIVKRMRAVEDGGRGSAEEMVSYGIEGLIHAVDNYDAARGAAFSTFAALRIRGSIADARRRMDVLSRTQRTRLKQIEDANLKLAAELRRWPSRLELAASLGIRPSELAGTLALADVVPLSLELIQQSGPAVNHAAWAVDLSEDRDPVVMADRRASIDILRNSLSCLSRRQLRLVQLRYGRGMEFRNIAKELNISEARVYQVHREILGCLRCRLTTESGLAA